MNRRLVLKLQGALLLLEAGLMLPSLFVAVYYGDGDAPAFLWSMATLVLCGLPLWLFAKPAIRDLRAREGVAVVGLSWLLLSAFGALPFVFSGVIPHFEEAFFEAVSGFTTTGSSIMTKIDGQPHGIMFWRSFTHWIGGMGVLVLTLAILPHFTGRSSHLIRAESPGPSLSKLVPKLGDMAKILYLIYTALTLVQVVLLLIAGMSPFDSLIHTFGTAGTGGFSNYALSVGHFQSPWVDAIITVFMIIFGVNFAIYYRILTGSVKEALKSEELRFYLGVVLAAILVTALLILPQYGHVGQAFRHGSFQVASIVSTTGYATQNFVLWPQAVKVVLVLLMFMGSCAGSTAGGLKAVRVALLFKIGRREMRHSFQPRKMQVVRFDGKGVEESMLHQLPVYFFLYLGLLFLGMLLISFENRFDVETNFTAALTCISNVGPGLGQVGPMDSFAGYSAFSKVVLSLLMLIGRLEIFPMMALFHPSLWKRQ